MAEQTDLGKTTLGMAANIEGGLAYLFGVITGIIFYVLEKENKFVKFHAMQSILFCGLWIVVNAVLMIIPVLGWAVAGVLNIAGLVLWVIVLLKAFQGEKFKLPVLGDIAEKNA